jgi:hypothetical protein
MIASLFILRENSLYLANTYVYWRWPLSGELKARKKKKSVIDISDARFVGIDLESHWCLTTRVAILC